MSEKAKSSAETEKKQVKIEVDTDEGDDIPLTPVEELQDQVLNLQADLEEQQKQCEQLE